jgi:hypothetical protein
MRDGAEVAGEAGLVPDRADGEGAALGVVLRHHRAVAGEVELHLGAAPPFTSMVSLTTVIGSKPPL